MPYQIEWIYQNQVLMITFTEPMTDDHINALDKEMIVLINEDKAHLVHVIMDASQMKNHPQPNKFRHVEWAKQHRTGWVTMVVTNIFIRFMSSVVAQTMNLRWRPFATVAQCAEFIKGIDDSLAEWDTSTLLEKQKT